MPATFTKGQTIHAGDFTFRVTRVTRPSVWVQVTNNRTGMKTTAAPWNRDRLAAQIARLS